MRTTLTYSLQTELYIYITECLQLYRKIQMLLLMHLNIMAFDVIIGNIDKIETWKYIGVLKN